MNNNQTMELLVFGWTREQIPKSNLNTWIPTDIINLFLSFYGAIFNWIFYGDKLKRFMHRLRIDDQRFIQVFKDEMEFNQASMKSDFFNVNNILFQGVIKPHEMDENRIKYVSFSLEIPDFVTKSNNIQQIIVYFELYCEETNFLWKCIKIFSKNKKSMSWWNKCNTMDISQHRNKFMLHCGCLIDILYIKYIKDTERVKTFRKPIKINKDIQFEYKINYSLNNLIKQTKTLFSNNFGVDNNWSIYCAPNGIHRNDFDNIHFGIQIFGLPPKVKAIRARITAQIKEYNFNISQMAYLNYQYNSCQIGIISLSTLSQKIVKIDGFCMLIMITIIDVFGFDDNLVPKQKWKEYGIEFKVISKPIIKRLYPKRKLPKLPDSNTKQLDETEICNLQQINTEKETVDIECDDMDKDFDEWDIDEIDANNEDIVIHGYDLDHSGYMMQKK